MKLFALLRFCKSSQFSGMKILEEGVVVTKSIVLIS